MAGRFPRRSPGRRPTPGDRRPRSRNRLRRLRVDRRLPVRRTPGGYQGERDHGTDHAHRAIVESGTVIRAALFDFGGVILTSPFEAFNRYEAGRAASRSTSSAPSTPRMHTPTLGHGSSATRSTLRSSIALFADRSRRPSDIVSPAPRCSPSSLAIVRHDDGHGRSTGRSRQASSSPASRTTSAARDDAGPRSTRCSSCST